MYDPEERIAHAARVGNRLGTALRTIARRVSLPLRDQLGALANQTSPSMAAVSSPEIYAYSRTQTGQAHGYGSRDYCLVFVAERAVEGFITLVQSDQAPPDLRDRIETLEAVAACDSFDTVEVLGSAEDGYYLHVNQEVEA